MASRARSQARSVDAETASRAKDVDKRLRRAIPDPRPELDFDDPFQLLIATVLSAQSTDKTVNRVTPELFRHYPSADALAQAEQTDVESLIKPTGFFRNKAKALISVSKRLSQDHGGEVPSTMDELVALPGVARKTANVVLGAAYGVASGVVVDTHAKRVAGRLALTAETEPSKIERDLCAEFPKRSWVAIGNRFVLHGRYVCTSKAPDCAECPLAERCPGRQAEGEGRWTARADREKDRIEEGRAKAQRQA